MPRLSLYKPEKGKDYEFLDKTVTEMFTVGGTDVFVHKYLGPSNPDEEDATPTAPRYDAVKETNIQDMLFLENRDRKYDPDIYVIRGIYNVQDVDFDMSQFGLFLTNDTLFMNFHTESMVEAVGRRLMPGDVLELPHLRDDLLLGSDEAINRFYVVTDANRPAEGYDPRWWSHLWRVKLGPITDSQEYRDILGSGEEEGDLRNLISTYADEIKISDAILEQAERDVPFDPQYRDTAHLYFDEEVPDKPAVGLAFGGNDGQPINGLSVVGSGDSFPTSGTNDGDFFLRTDFSPNRLFKKSGSRWLNVGSDERGNWSAANRILSTFINNENITTNSDGETQSERVPLSKVVKPQTDN